VVITLSALSTGISTGFGFGEDDTTPLLGELTGKTGGTASGVLVVAVGTALGEAPAAGPVVSAAGEAEVLVVIVPASVAEAAVVSGGRAVPSLCAHAKNIGEKTKNSMIKNALPDFISILQ
jgi:hypothetical protein